MFKKGDKVIIKNINSDKNTLDTKKIKERYIGEIGYIEEIQEYDRYVIIFREEILLSHGNFRTKIDGKWYNSTGKIWREGEFEKCPKTPRQQIKEILLGGI